MKKSKKIIKIIVYSLILFFIAILVYAYIISPGKQFDYESTYLKENKTEFVDIGGSKIHYLQKGQGDPLILIHGGAGWLYSFRNNIDELSKHFTVYAIEMPGHGYTQYSEDEKLDLKYVGNIIESFMEKENISKASFVGNSWGGGWALYFAQQYPEKTNKLVLIDASGLGDSVKKDMSVWPLMNYPILGELLVHFFTYESVKEGYAYYDKSKLDESVFKEYFKPLTFSRNLRSQYNYQRNLDWSITDKRLNSMETPTLIIWGKYDNVLPVSMAFEYAKRIKNSRIQIIEGASHLPHEEKPDEVNKIIIDFMNNQ